MTLSFGTRLGPYEIVAPLGAGGMGEVYRAKDTKLNRDVAIKVLPESFATDADRVARFTREAQVLASLNHPNIAQIYGIEESKVQGPGSSVRALVMELVEGQDLSEMIGTHVGPSFPGLSGADGSSATPGSGGAKAPPYLPHPLPLADALAIARQIADALEAAHEQGIIHRDLKPQNIKVRPDGTVKVLDFGLAKALDRTLDSGPGTLDAANSPTLTVRGTQMGMIIGTAAYMAPEQARGRAVDRRADVWAFGAVFYEMLTGTRAFPGDDITDVLAAVVRAEPEWSLLPKDLSPTLLTFLKRCLQKDAKQRLGDIHDMRLALDGAFDTIVPAHTATASSSAARARLGWIVASVLALALVSALIPAVRYLRTTPPDQGEVRFQIPLHEMPNALLTSISPDGRWIAYAGRSDDGRSVLWLQSLASLTAHVLPGTEDAGVPFWSPDSRTIAFISARKLKTVAASGGPVTTIADRIRGRGTWGRDGVILVGNQGDQDNARGILRIPAGGGEPTAATTLDPSGEEAFHDFPYFLPDGKHFLYVAWSQQPQKRALYVASLDSTERKRLMPAESMAVYSSGQLLFLRSRNLMAQDFDVDRLELSGEPRLVAEDIPTNPSIGGAAFNASTNGTLIYRTGPGFDADGRQLVWFDRRGKNLGALGGQDGYQWVRISNDGKRVATVLTDSDGNGDVWAIDVDRGARSRITFDPKVEHFPNWSSDGRTLYFASMRHGKFEISQASSTGTGGEQLIHGHPDTFTPLRDVSVDGQYLVYGTSKDGVGQRDIWVLPTFGDRKAFPFVQTPFEEYLPALSPDNRWMAYTTNESGGPQVVVQSFPDPSRAKYPISINGGSEPRWRRDGKELYFVAPDHKLMAVTITGDRELAMGTPVALFDTALPFPQNDGSQSPRYFDVTADGQRFLINAPKMQSNPSPITVVLNWAAGLKAVSR